LRDWNLPPDILAGVEVEAVPAFELGKAHAHRLSAHMVSMPRGQALEKLFEEQFDKIE
jgi:hypothetical protein